MISKEVIDEAVKRVLTAKFNLGLFENPYVDASLANKLNANDEHRSIAKKAALESFVLLKNENNLLPFDKEKIKNIVVIGEDAVEARLGGYSGPGHNVISILQGIKTKVKDFVKVEYKPGCGRNDEKQRAKWFDWKIFW